MLSLVTVAAVPEHRCEILEHDVNKTYTQLNETSLGVHIPRLQSGRFDSCSLINTTTNATYKCDSWVFDHTYYGSSRAIEWEFVCDQRWMGAVAQSAYMFGVFTGAVWLGNLADKVGRKPVFCWSAVLQVILGVGVAFTPEYISFLIIRYLYGIFGSAGSYIPGFVLTMELVGPSKRSMCGVAFQAAFALGIMLVAGWGSIIKDRQLLQIIYGCHALVLCGHFWLMDESPRWLWANGRTTEAVRIISRALKMNKSSVTITPEDYTGKAAKEQRTKNDQAGVLDLFKTPNLRNKTLNIMLCWFANSLVYYGLSLSTGSMKGNPYLVLFVMGLVELPSYVVTVYLMDRLGRRSLTSFEMIAGGICCIIAANLAEGPVSTGFVFAGKFLIASSFAIVYNYSAELFPTVIRNSAMGLGAMCARTSGALTPLITLLDSFDPKMPAIIFAVIALISGFLVTFLPETLDKAMPQTIEDGEKFGAGDTCFTAICAKGATADDEDENQKTEMEEQPLKS
ncbi:unnamed protein product [Acanthoscelides obtectus]|uniref:Major facilitator superfamily (MFS) profile domain-containing protein n=2 Tax=Acanthoscelides obtectus TaxID=200917 RepID=A0A9P0LSE8_ACAOB|nr:unnamed protein product [Acanthoscelides obtectus]CAK1667826.1 Organic cation transporter protein [Acanthoscelides obtectus]